MALNKEKKITSLADKALHVANNMEINAEKAKLMTNDISIKANSEKLGTVNRFN